MADASALVEVPSIAEDSAIQRAFEHLDAQMDAWVDAMKRVEQTLAAATVAESVVAAAPSVSIDPNVPVPQAVARTAEASVASAAIPIEADVPPEVESEAEPEVVAEAGIDAGIELQESVAASVPSQLAAEPEPVAEQVVCRPEAEAPVEAPADLASDQDAVPAGRASDDEALLATLDEETAKAIKVMRRMCMNTKSVSQLLTEYQAKKESQSAAASAKKSWFRRGK